MTETDRALVLGPGGVVGTAWTAGLAHGLRRVGVDPGQADLIVGTSAGAIVGALLATGQDLGRLAAPARPAEPDDGPRGDPALMAQVFALLGDPRLEPAEARRQIGRLALDAPTVTEEAHVTEMAALLGTGVWPEDRRLLIPAVDVGTGEARIWDRDSGAPLASAVAASCAAPGAYPPVTIDGRRYMDGAFRAGVNTDLAAGAGVLVVVEPLAHLFPAQRDEGEPAGIVRVVPDAAALELFGTDLHDHSSWRGAFRAGVRQAAEVAGRVEAVWDDDARREGP